VTTPGGDNIPGERSNSPRGASRVEAVSKSSWRCYIGSNGSRRLGRLARSGRKMSLRETNPISMRQHVFC
jgi:hypothetical protein